MFDPATVKATATVLSLLNGAVATTKSLLNLKSAKDNMELMDKLHSLYKALFESQTQIIEVREIIREKDAKIKDLEERFKRDSELVFNQKYGLWECEENGELVRYCTKCHTAGKYIPVQDSDNCFICKNCDQVYDKPEKAPKCFVDIGGCGGGSVPNPFEDL